MSDDGSQITFNSDLSIEEMISQSKKKRSSCGEVRITRKVKSSNSVENSGEMDLLRRELKERYEKENHLKTEIEMKEAENKALKAIVRQYRCKFKKVRSIAMAAID